MKNTIAVLCNCVCVFLAIWLILAAPTGWIYDLWAGEGTEQGQRPNESVQLLQRQEDVETFFLTGTPATVSGDGLVACPLARLRDVGQAGEHYKNGPGRRSVYVSEYITADYPLSWWDRTIQGIVGGYYNRYYLMELEDGAYLCIYFDDYLLLAGGEDYPTGYVRYTTTEERRMLNRMVEDYDLDTVYVLDMYRYGKVNWMLDLTLRLGVLAAAAFVVVRCRDLRQKKKTTEKD